MDWAAGVERDSGGKLCVIWQDKDGQVTRGSIERLRSALPVPGGQHGFGATELSLGSLHSTRDYLDAIGMGHLESGGQTCCSVPSSAGELVIPAQLLVNAVLGPIKHMRAVLFTPQGPKALMTVFADKTGMKAERTPSRMREFHESRHVGASRVEWAQSFPSGSRAWASVYARAISGVLDIALPAVLATASFSAFALADRLYVVGLTFDRFDPAEAPHEFAREMPAFQDQSVSPSAEPVSHDVLADKAQRLVVPKGWGNSPMTDQHWNDVEAAFADIGRRIRRKTQTHSSRDRLDLIRAHLATGAPFTRLPAHPGLQRAAKVLYYRLRQYDGWSKFEHVLKNTL